MRPRPTGLLRIFFGVPPLIYRVLDRFGASEVMRRRMVMLTTRGRRSGRPRTTALNYALDDGTVYVMSGFGRTDWIRNIEADPHVEVALGREHWRGDAHLVTDPEERRRAMRAARAQAVTQGPPAVVAAPRRSPAPGEAPATAATLHAAPNASAGALTPQVPKVRRRARACEERRLREQRAKDHALNRGSRSAATRSRVFSRSGAAAKVWGSAGQ